MSLLFDDGMDYALDLDPLTVLFAGFQACEAGPVGGGGQTGVSDFPDFRLRDDRGKLTAIAHPAQIDQRADRQGSAQSSRDPHENATRPVAYEQCAATVAGGGIEVSDSPPQVHWISARRFAADQRVNLTRRCQRRPRGRCLLCAHEPLTRRCFCERTFANDRQEKR